jgi:hypothetical protein
VSATVKVIEPPAAEYPPDEGVIATVGWAEACGTRTKAAANPAIPRKGEKKFLMEMLNWA